MKIREEIKEKLRSVELRRIRSDFILKKIVIVSNVVPKEIEYRKRLVIVGEGLGRSSEGILVNNVLCYES